jgi:REP element-mobilizing transposase RayT
MLVHLTARVLPGLHLLVDIAAAWWLWRRLRQSWPSVLAAVLMDNHLHLLARVANPRDGSAALGALLGGHARHVGRVAVWEPVLEPTPLTTPKHLLRSVRYIHLNPVRAGLVPDPLEWPFSTHRGVVGAELDPWVRLAELAHELRRPTRSAAEWLHQYVSADAETNPAGTPMPVPVAPVDFAAVPPASLDRIVAAAISATPWSSLQERRHLIVLLARHQGIRSTSAIAAAAGLSARHVRELSLEPNSALLAAGTRCLGDSRLIVPTHLQAPPARVRRSR